MFLGLERHWWLVILAALIIIIPLKVKFMIWWGRREQDRKKEQRGKWGMKNDRGFEKCFFWYGSYASGSL